MANSTATEIIVSQLDTFTKSYIETALWSSSDDEGSLNEMYTVDDIDPATLTEMVEDCQAFQESFSEHFENGDAVAGHDFWLTRNRHGAGFWDGDYSDEAGKFLTEMSKAYGEFYLYVGDDNCVYAVGCEPG